MLGGLTAADDVALPFLARTLGAGDRGIGTLYAGVAAGLVVGYLLVVRAGSRVSATTAFLVGSAVAAGGNLLTGAAPALGAAVAFQVLRGVGTAAFETGLQTSLQRTVPAHLRGRVFANVYGGIHVTAALSLLAGGPLLDATSARSLLVTVGFVGLGATTVSAFLLAPTRRPRP